MPNAIAARLKVWYHEALRPWWAMVLVLFALLSRWDTIRRWLGAADRWGVAAALNEIPRWGWWVAWLALTVVVVLESPYRISVERTDLKQKLDKKRDNQELSDKLSDLHEYGVHKVLNMPPGADEDIDAWLKKDSEWVKTALRVMRKYGCSKQEKRHVNTLGLVPGVFIHPNPLVAHRMNMILVRLGRIADIAGKYGD